MKLATLLKRTAICIILIGFLASCQSGKNPAKMVGSLKPLNPDEAAIYATLEGIKTNISNSHWDEWLALYSDDAVLTNGKDKLSKAEMKKAVEGIDYKISKMEILDQKIESDNASISVSMVGNGKKHLETYKFKKMNGKWLIVEETNP